MKISYPDVSAEYANDRFSYDPLTGQIRWKDCYFPSRNGKVAGTVGADGYLRIRLVGKNTLLAHRVVWLMVHGSWPLATIDHINGDKTDNRIANLRDISHAENLQNIREPYKSKRTHLLGVSERRSGKNRHEAKIRVKGKSTVIGSYSTPELAHEAYLKAKRKVHPASTI